MKIPVLIKNLRHRLVACLAVPIGLSLASCGGKKDPEPSGKAEESGEKPAAPEANSPGETAAAATPVVGTTPSQHFGAVAKQLDLGGAVFAYVDVDGDLEGIVDLIQGFLDSAKQDAGEDMPPHLQKLELSKVLAKLGLGGIEAMGMSSYKDGDLYRNKGFVYIPAGREGILELVGGEAKPFVAKELAPQDADLVFEQSLDARAGFKVASSMVADLGGPEASAQFMQMVGEVMPQLGLSMADLFRKLDTRITVIGRVHPDKPMEMPDVPVEIPSFDLMVVLDDMGWLYESMTTEMKKEMPEDQLAQIFSGGDGFERMLMPPMPPETPIAQPVVHHDAASKRVLIASSPAFLDECLAGNSSLSANPEFVAATEGLPMEGNGLSFVSKRLMEEYTKLMKGAMEADGGAETAAISGMMSMVIPEAKGGQASVMVNMPDGILMSSNSTSSMKETVMMGGVAGVAIVASITVPALRMAQEKAQEAQADQMRRMEELRALQEENDRVEEIPAPAPPAVPE